MRTADEILREAALWMPGLLEALDEDIDPDETFITVRVGVPGQPKQEVVKRSLTAFMIELREWAVAHNADMMFEKQT